MPLGVGLSLTPEGGTLQTEDTVIDLAQVDAVWMRHTDVAAGVRHLVDPAHAAAMRVQTTAALWDLVDCLPHADHFDRLAALRTVPGPVAMLRWARDAGLAVPRTLASSDPTAVAAFIDGTPGPTIQKMLDSSASRVPRPGGADFLPTLRTTARDRARLDRVAVCPMVFQEEVPKQHELRVTVVGDRLFTAAIDPRGTVDWRQHPELVRSFTPWRLDPAVGHAILRLMDRLGLELGTVDLIVRPDGRHVFLEVNTVSFFDFVEEPTRLPISEAVADLLTGQRRPRLAGATPTPTRAAG